MGIEDSDTSENDKMLTNRHSIGHSTSLGNFDGVGISGNETGNSTLKRGRRTLVLLCGACCGISYCDRVNLSVAVVDMGNEFGWDLNQRGQVLGAFFWGYLLSQVAGAVLSKVYGGHVVLGYAALFWSISTFIVPFCAKISFQVLWLNRILLGVAEGVTFPSVYHLFALNVPSAERSRSLACLSTGVFMGAVFAFLVSPFIMKTYGWEMVFYFFGIVGIAWLLCWGIFWVHNSRIRNLTARVVACNSVEKSESTWLSQMKNELASVFDMSKKALHSSLICCIFWCHFCHNTGHYVLMAWLPTYFDSQLGIHGSNLSLTCIPYIIMSIVVALASFLADKVIKGGKDIPTVRRFSTCFGFTLAGGSLCMLSITSSPTMAIFLLCLALASNGAGPAAGYEAAKLDILHPSQTGKVHSLSNTFATLAGLIGIPMVAYINEATKSWGATFAFVGLFFISAAVGFYKYGRWSGQIKL